MLIKQNKANQFTFNEQQQLSRDKAIYPYASFFHNHRVWGIICIIIPTTLLGWWTWIALLPWTCWCGYEMNRMRRLWSIQESKDQQGELIVTFNKKEDKQ